ncbi:ribosome-associated translation inhibitor RaiA [Gulosibacter sp. 10]|uniref:ribosome hibernation-promoting factor, HPF/YfiA family n=1 Tax=Gulosibacter sp. 10 TaxID=1255570 RepID=UPI00097ECD3B|nr:ribosome-associated translation inhibitor RaiA [Gulosibacter sp. 10]SJM54427.1 Ribosomal subunit interface protein [Gulosibacter sp. 10]
MDVTISGRNTEIPDRFREYADEKVTAKVQQLSDRAQSVEVKLKRRTDRAGNNLDRGKVEITIFGPFPTIRAEAEAGDKYAAFDIALDKLVERLRRVKDKKKTHRGKSLAEAAAGEFADLDIVPADTGIIDVVSGKATPASGDGAGEGDGYEDYNPIVIREKVFAPKQMTSSEAVDHMELLGHDFFLFIESETKRPSVVYRRRGWDYGVIALGEEGQQVGAAS